MAADPDKPTLSERFTRAVIKADSGPTPEAEGPETVEELEAAVARADDKERLVGLAAAPLAGLVAIIVVSTLSSKSGQSVSSVDSTLSLVLFGLALVMLAGAWFRKRLFIGIASALYGLSVFNLHYWGFGVPFLIVGSWYLVRAYRLSQKLKLAKADDAPSGPRGSSRPAQKAQPNKRYTPPVTGPAKPPKPPKSDS
jgi:hypothetical protein